MSEFRDKQRSKWLRVARTWYDTEPPAIPSQGDLSIFSQVVRNVPAEILVLGSTPSLRAIAAERAERTDGHTLVMDLSREMYEGSSVYAEHDMSRERFVQGDWCIPCIGTAKLSAIIGDKAIDNIEINEWPHFFSEMRRILQVDGLLVLHVGLTDESLTIRTVMDALHSWAMKVRSEGRTIAEASAGLWEDLLSASWDRGPGGALSLSYWEPELSGLQSQPLEMVEQKIVERFIADFGQTFGDVWSDCRLSAVLVAALDYFDLITLKYAADYLQAAQQPLMAFRPKR